MHKIYEIPLQFSFNKRKKHKIDSFSCLLIFLEFFLSVFAYMFLTFMQRAVSRSRWRWVLISSNTLWVLLIFIIIMHFHFPWLSSSFFYFFISVLFGKCIFASYSYSFFRCINLMERNYHYLYLSFAPHAFLKL